MAKLTLKYEGDGFTVTRETSKFYTQPDFEQVDETEEPTWRELVYEFKQLLDGIGYVFSDETNEKFEELYTRDDCISKDDFTNESLENTKEADYSHGVKQNEEQSLMEKFIQLFNETHIKRKILSK